MSYDGGEMSLSSWARVGFAITQIDEAKAAKTYETRRAGAVIGGLRRTD
jgi:hydrogenase maturation factor